MSIIRYRPKSSSSVAVGLLLGEEVTPLPDVTTLAQLWRLRSGELSRLIAAASASRTPIPASEVEILAPIDEHTEVWACGVTYEISREARVEESEKAANVYMMVYDAERPELFFKSVAWRVAGPGAQIGVRSDSTVNVPEPELALIVNRFGEVVGYTICNDVSSRSIEGENPLYLPQAKVYSGACALGPGVVPAWEVTDPYALDIQLAIDRRGERYWEGTASTSQLHRRLDELVGYLLRGDVHPDGVVLSTGTSLVPSPPFTLTEGDVVSITIDGLGTLSNPVVRGRVRHHEA